MRTKKDGTPDNRQGHSGRKKKQDKKIQVPLYLLESIVNKAGGMNDLKLMLYEVVKSHFE